MSLAILGGALSAFTVAEFNTFLSKARVAEAFHVADEARLRMTEFYLLSARFPTTPAEIDALTRSIPVTSDVVRGVELEPSNEGRDVVLKIYLGDEPLAGGVAPSSFIFVAGDAADRGGRDIDWRCGARGVDPELLPSGCVPIDG
ncbi:MAG: pilin [Xanthomonadales bacterium]